MIDAGGQGITVAIVRHLLPGFGNCQFPYKRMGNTAKLSLDLRSPAKDWLSPFILTTKTSAFCLTFRRKKLSHSSEVTWPVPWDGTISWALKPKALTMLPCGPAWPLGTMYSTGLETVHRARWADHPRTSMVKGPPRGAPPLPSAAVLPAFAPWGPRSAHPAPGVCSPLALSASSPPRPLACPWLIDLPPRALRTSALPPVSAFSAPH